MLDIHDVIAWRSTYPTLRPGRRIKEREGEVQDRGVHGPGTRCIGCGECHEPSRITTPHAIMQRKQKEYTPEALKSTTMLLDQNPEYYTIWNYRRNIMTNGLFPTM